MNLRTIRQRIRSVQSTQKITRAMQMVAGAKLRRAQEELMAFRPYADALERISQRFLRENPGLEHPLLEAPGTKPPIGTRYRSPVSYPVPDVGFVPGTDVRPPPAGLVIVSSDTGLCGTYNERLIGEAERFLLGFPSAVLVTIGKKATRHFARRTQKGPGRPGTLAKQITDWGGRYEWSRAGELLSWLEEQFLARKVSGWSIAYTQFLSALSWRPMVKALLPLDRPAPAETPEKVIVEPDAPRFAESLLRQSVRGRFGRSLLEGFTAEHSARMMAMKNATENAGEMISSLTLVRNKVRQAAITKELIEVVSGAQALQ
ncbi:MAG: ATP synthase F1 subunit gamma [Candidatus Omnitrophica bacterium]|nr:ATP synthase F1 subunit gamma [Candidatus Omnitrophota bacterium]